MFRYYVWLALKSLNRNRILTALMIAAIGVGIGACMTALTVFRLMSGDPIPWKSDRLFAVQLDSWGADGAYNDDDPKSAPDQLTYRDARALVEAGKAKRQTMMFSAVFPVQPANKEVKPFMSTARMTYADFFPMFEPPFKYGSAWTSTQDANAEHVVVLSKETNERVFGGENSVGKELRLGNFDYTVVGVLDAWRPSPRYFDVTQGGFEEPESMYLPLTLNDSLKMHSSGNNNCWKGIDGSTYEAYLASECVWTQFWVELDSKKDAEQYLAFLNDYTNEQKKLGRFPRPLNNKLPDVMDWLSSQHVVGNDIRIQLWLSVAFLVVCLLNTVGLLLAKFLGRASETGLRRALGASRRQVFAQHLIEAGGVGAAGALVGIALSWIGLKGVAALNTDAQHLSHLDLPMVLVAVLLSLTAAVLAGLYPTWRACQVAPAAQLKSN